MKVDPEFLTLCGAARDETLTPEQLATLETRLVDDPEARRYYLDFMQLHSYLESFPPIEDEAPRPILAFPKRAATVWLAAAAAVAIACVLGLFWRPGTLSSPLADESIAILLFSEDCVWENKTATREGEPLGPGTIGLTSGTAIIRFGGGAEAVLTGPTKIELVSAMEARLEHGNVVIRAEDGAEGFILNTPTRRLIDLGTEFAVSVEDDGMTELHVHEGLVALGNAEADEVVTAGHAVRMEKAAPENATPVGLDAPRFAELIESVHPRERRDLMTVYEGFNVDAGNYLPGEMTGGKGWAAPWRLRSESEIGPHTFVRTRPALPIVHGKMDIAWPIKGGQNGMLKFSKGSTVRIREMEQSINLDRWGMHYFSFMVTEPRGERGKRERNEREDIRMTFRSSDEYFGESLSFGWEWNRKPRVSVGLQSIYRSVREVPAGETLFCVGKIVTRKNGKDRVNFRFYGQADRLNFAEPAEWDVSLPGMNLSADLDLIVLTSISETQRFIDEIRVGPSWRSVVPLDPNLIAD